MSASAETLIRELADTGVRLSRRGDRLHVEATPGTVTPELRLTLSERKAELLAAVPADDIPDPALASAAADIALRESGKRPPDETAPARCRSCGPVWIAPEIARIAPVVAGWPRVLGCPWCHVTNRNAIPRPMVTCEACVHFRRDPVNPKAGMGACALGAPPQGEPPTYPNARRQCERHSPEECK